MSEVPRNREFWTGVLKRIARRTGGASNAEDLMHSAFVRMEEYRANRPVTNPAAFLVRTAVNIHIDDYRYNQRVYGKTRSEPPDYIDLGTQADDLVAAKELLSRLVSGINQLPDRTREIFLMHRIDKLQYSHIAQRQGISVSAVEKHMAKAILFLARRAEEL